jgi:hypothetical protein
MPLIALILLSLLSFTQSGHIYSWDPQITYDWDGSPIQINIPYMLETEIEQGGLILLTLPFQLSDVRL